MTHSGLCISMKTLVTINILSAMPNIKIPCHFKGCHKKCKSSRGLTYHIRSVHENHNMIHSSSSSLLSNSSSSNSPSPTGHLSRDFDFEPQQSDENSNSPPHQPPQPPQPVKLSYLPSNRTFHPYLTGRYRYLL